MCRRSENAKVECVMCGSASSAVLIVDDGTCHLYTYTPRLMHVLLETTPGCSELLFIQKGTMDPSLVPKTDRRCTPQRDRVLIPA